MEDGSVAAVADVQRGRRCWAWPCSSARWPCWFTARLHYLVATAIAVEAAVLHNFCWHQRWTWRDRRAASRTTAVRRLGRFHLLNGAGFARRKPRADGAAHGGLRDGSRSPPTSSRSWRARCVNFFASEVLVFKPLESPRCRAGLCCAVLQPVRRSAADDDGRADGRDARGVAAVRAQVEDAYDSRHAGTIRSSPTTRSRAEPGGGSRRVAGHVDGHAWHRPRPARVSHRRAGRQDPPLGRGDLHSGRDVDTVIAQHLRERAGRESESLRRRHRSKLLVAGRRPISDLHEAAARQVITVTYNTEHSVGTAASGSARASSRSIATKIAELANAGHAAGARRSPGNDTGTCGG